MSRFDEISAHAIPDPASIVELQITHRVVQELLAELDRLPQMGLMLRALQIELDEATRRKPR